MIELPEIAVNAGSPPSDMRYPYEYVERHGKACAEAARAAAIEECAALITPPEPMRRIDGAAYNNCMNLASAIRRLLAT